MQPGWARCRTRNVKELRTMRFMMLVIPKGYEKAAADFAPPAELVARMTKYNDSLTKAGVLLGLDGLRPPATGARVRFAGGKPKVTDGPFTEAKEVLGGYWIIQVKSRAEAIEWAKRAPMQDGDIIEVRQVQEISDFPPDVQKAAGRLAMRFLSIVKSAENQGPAPQALQDAMAKLTRDSLKDGSLVQSGGLGASSTGVRVRSAGGKLTVIDGPFSEAKEVVGGYAVLEFKSRDE